MRRISWMFPTLLIAGLAMIRPWSDRIAAQDAQQQVNDRLRGWVYPGSSLLGTGEGEVQGGNNPPIFGTSAVMMTPDTFEAVLRYYKEEKGFRSGREDPKGQLPIGASSLSTSNDSRNRPLKLIIMEKRRESDCATLVISRGNDEKWTHVYFSIHNH